MEIEDYGGKWGVVIDECKMKAGEKFQIANSCPVTFLHTISAGMEFYPYSGIGLMIALDLTGTLILIIFSISLQKLVVKLT